MIRFKKLPLDESDFKAVKEVMKSKSLSMGKKVSELEKEFAEYVGCGYAVAVNSCTSALFLSLARFDPRDILIPSMTVPLVANTVIHAGHKLEFIDEIDWVGGSYRLNGGSVVDSAHEVKPRTDWNMHDCVCYSFYPTKPICSAEGGMICTNSDKDVEMFRKARWYGRNEGDSNIKNSWEYTIEFPGWKLNMTDIQAAIALNQLRKLPGLTKRREYVRDTYNEILGEKNTSLYLYRINVKKRDEFIGWALEKGIECGVHFAPLHTMKAYKSFRPKSYLTKTMEEYETTVSLPFHDSLTDKEIDIVCSIVKEWEGLCE